MSDCHLIILGRYGISIYAKVVARSVFKSAIFEDSVTNILGFNYRKRLTFASLYSCAICQLRSTIFEKGLNGYIYSTTYANNEHCNCTCPLY